MNIVQRESLLKISMGERDILQNPFAVDVELTGEEFGHMLALAQKRQQPKEEDSRAKDKRIMDRDNVKTHHIGLCGEFAVQELLHIPLDEDSYLSGDTVKDFEINGLTIEVKTLKGYLTFRYLSDFKADIAVLVQHNNRNPRRLSIQGWISRNEFIKNHFKDDFGYGIRPCMQPIDLHAISSLRMYCLQTSYFRWLLAQIHKSSAEQTRA